MVKKTAISCSTCNKEDTWRQDNSFRPFCSDRCKLIDLGEWASDKRAIPGEPADLNNLPFSDEEDET